MSRNQRISISIGLVALAATWLFPPCSDDEGYFFLLSSQHHGINFGVLIGESVVVGLLLISTFIAFGSSTPKSRNVDDMTRQDAEPYWRRPNPDD